MSERLQFAVPLVPPSVNHYVKHFRNGGHVKTGEAQAFKDAVALYARHDYCEGKEFAVAIRVILGRGDRGDVDNFPKLVLDGLADCGAFQSSKGNPLSDAHVRDLRVIVDRKSRPARGSTAIIVEALA